jgi:hypothetical protein
MLSWDDLAKHIVAMSEEDRRQPVVMQDENTGAYLGFRDVVRIDPEEYPENPLRGCLRLKTDWIEPERT